MISRGESTSKESPSTSRFGYILELDRRWQLTDSSYLNIEFEFAKFKWTNHYGPTIDGGAIIPILRYNSQIFQHPFFLALGVGGAYISETRWHKRKLGNNWLFEDKFELGTHFLDSHRLSFSLRHYSNADTNKDNDGTNILSVNYSFHW